MPRKIRTLLLALVAVLALTMLVMRVFLMGWATPRSPNPNGYDDFLKAAGSVTGDVGHAWGLDRDGLRALVSANSEALRLVRLGLSRQCAVPADSAMTNVEGTASDLAGIERLAQLLAAEGRLWEMDNRLADAARSYLDAIHLGNETSRGGFLINRGFGIACEKIGGSPLSKLAPKLSKEEARSLIVELEKIDNSRVPWEEIRRNENRLVLYVLGRGFHHRLTTLAHWMRLHSRSAQRAEASEKRAVACFRLLTTKLAMRCYQSEQASAPTALAQLVPTYLQRVPLDPFSGRPIIYSSQGTNWLLYSVGEHGVDDGGKGAGPSVSGAVTKGDLFYDTPN